MHKAAKPAGGPASPRPDWEVHVPGIGGSLRAAQVNRTWLQAIRELAPAGSGLSYGKGWRPCLGSIPISSRCFCLRQRVTAADGLLIASPE